jgi:hypothetical protein
MQPHVLVVGGVGQYFLDLSLLTFVVRLGDGSTVKWCRDGRGKRTGDGSR